MRLLPLDEGARMVFGSWERKLRNGGGRSAPASVIEIHKGRSIPWTNSGINGQPGAKIQEGTVATHDVGPSGAVMTWPGVDGSG